MVAVAWCNLNSIEDMSTACATKVRQSLMALTAFEKAISGGRQALRHDGGLWGQRCTNVQLSHLRPCTGKMLNIHRLHIRFGTVLSCLPNRRRELNKKEEKNRMQRHHWVTMEDGEGKMNLEKNVVTEANSKQVCSACCFCFEESRHARVQSLCWMRWKGLRNWQGPTRVGCKDIIGPQHGQASGNGLHGTWSKKDGEGKTNLAHLGWSTVK